ncbi:hypothetical protein [Halomarina rubra]|uniref:Uncharacterized protein n=1 Tax=Halomarina rubra TaxID=2071873 RepID=A0ABD6B022_9EURY|nr:hypothetical protein [Halomarina rubra]
MDRGRVLEWCYLVLGVVLFVEFLVVLDAALVGYGLLALLASLGSLAYYGYLRVGAGGTASRGFVVAFVVFTAGVVVWVLVQLLSRYVLL